MKNTQKLVYRLFWKRGDVISTWCNSYRSKPTIQFFWWTSIQQISNDHHPIAWEIDQGCRCLTTRWTNNSTPNIPSRECLCCSVTTAISVFSSDSVQSCMSCLINCEPVHLLLEEMRTLSVGACGQTSRGAGLGMIGAPTANLDLTCVAAAI